MDSDNSETVQINLTLYKSQLKVLEDLSKDKFFFGNSVQDVIRRALSEYVQKRTGMFDWDYKR